MKLRVVALFMVISGLACSTAPKVDPNTAEGAYAVAERYEKDERYEEAIAQYNSVKNKHPYSNLATESELKIADIYFKREEFTEAQVAYQAFKELHPTHSRIDYVTYRLGLSYFNQLPPTIDRDLSLADRTLLYMDEVLSSYPKSEFVGPAKEHKDKTLKMLAEKELYIADFYFKREKFDSALNRYERLLALYPGLGLDARALFGATISAHRLKDPDKTKSYLNQLKSRFADSKEAAQAIEELKDAQ